MNDEEVSAVQSSWLTVGLNCGVTVFQIFGRFFFHSRQKGPLPILSIKNAADVHNRNLDCYQSERKKGLTVIVFGQVFSGVDWVRYAF